MANVQKDYEFVLIVSMKLGEEGITAMVQKFKDLIEANATLGEIDEWGKRRLSYEIDFQTEGYYVLFNFTSGAEFPAELDRITTITEGIMRALIIRKN